MKNKAKWHAAVTLLAVLALLLALFAVACGGDGSQGSGDETGGVTLKLSATDGGTLEKTEYTLSAGDLLSEFLKDKTPTAEAGLEFAGWYEGSSPLASDRTMPAEGLTLTAKFYASYTVLLYYDDGAGNYADTPDETVTGKGIYGEAFSYVPAEHYSVDPAKESITSDSALGKNETFTVYLLRETHTVTYLADAPEGVLADVPAPAKAVYGLDLTLGTATLQADSVKTYRFLGWSSVQSGSVEYAAGDLFPMPPADVTLYAVWEKGLTDSMGGDDVIFLPADEPAAAYLLRNGFDLIKGDYAAETRIFTFKVSDEKSYAGRVSANGETFAWYDADAKVTYTLCDLQTDELTEDETLTLDGYDGAVYTPAEGTAVSGVYFSEGDGILFFSAQGKEFAFRVGVKETGTDEEDDPIMTDVFYISDGLFGTYYSEGGETSIDVDGFGTLTNDKGIYHYTVEGDGIITYSYFDDMWYEHIFVSYKLVTEESLGYEIKIYLTSDGLADTYTADDGSELVLDGFGGATYTPADGTPADGFYGVVLADEYDDNYDTYALIYVETDDGEFAFKLTYDHDYDSISSTMEALGEEFGEYETLLAAGDYQIATLFLYGDGTAEILFSFTSSYGEHSDTAFYGVYAEEDGVYRFTLTDVNDRYEDAVAEYQAQFENFLFRIGSINDVYYFSQYVESTDGTFTSAKDGTLVLDGYGTGTYAPSANGTASKIVYMKMASLYYVLDLASGYSFYIALDDGSFTVVGDEAGTYYLFTSESGGMLGSERLFLDGQGHAVFRYGVISGEDEDPEIANIEGTYLIANDGTFTFTSAEKTFSFRIDVLYEGDSAYDIFTKELEAEKTYISEEDGILIVDRFGKATWLDANSQSHEGFLAEQDGLLYLYTETDGYSDLFTFAVLGEENDRFALLGWEWGEYYLLEKGVLRDVVLDLDGHGGAKMYDDGVLVSEGTYETVEGTETELVYTPTEGEPFRFLLGTVRTNDGEEEHVYVVYHEAWDLVSHFDGDAWESLILDGYETAYYTDERGYISTYTYETLYETVLRLADLDAHVYRYYRIDREEGTFSPIEDDYVLSDDGTVLLVYRGTEGSIALPDTIVEVGEDAFYGTEVTSVDLNNVETVGESAFENVLLESLVAPKVKVIKTYAFFMNIYLQTIELPAIESIGDAAFRYCESLTSVTLGANLKSVGERAFLDLSGKQGTRFVLQGGVSTVSADDPETTGATENEASFEENALFEVKDLQTAQAFYADLGWTSYAAQICLKEEAPATFYTVTMAELLLDGQAKKDGKVLGVYVRTAATLTVYPYDNGTEQVGTFGADGSISFGGKNYLPEGTQVTFTDSAENTTLTFALSKKTTEATYNGENVPLTIGETITFMLGHYTYTVTLHDDRTFTTATEFTPYKVTYKCGSNGSLDLTFRDEDKKKVTVGTGSANSIKIAGRLLKNFGTITFGTPVWIEENVYELSITSTSTQNGTRSLPVVYKAVIRLNDADSTFTYTSSIEFTKVSLEGEEVKLIISYDNEFKVNDVSLAFGETAESVTFEANEAGTNITITVADGDHAGTYTAAITTSTGALTLTKTT